MNLATIWRIAFTNWSIRCRSKLLLLGLGVKSRNRTRLDICRGSWISKGNRNLIKGSILNRAYAISRPAVVAWASTRIITGMTVDRCFSRLFEILVMRWMLHATFVCILETADRARQYHWAGVLVDMLILHWRSRNKHRVIVVLWIIGLFNGCFSVKWSMTQHIWAQ